MKFLITAALLVLVSGCKSDAERYCVNSKEARSYAFFASQYFVDQKLKDPQSSEYGHSEDATVVYLGDCTFKVRSYVRASNSFGATVQNKYVATVKYLVADKTWGGKDVFISN